MKKQIITLTAAAALAFGVTVFAEDTTTNSTQPGQAATQEQMQQAKKDWNNMSASEKKEFRAEMKKAWENMTPDQQAEVKKRAQNKWKSMTPEQKKELIDKVVAEKSNGSSTN